MLREWAVREVKEHFDLDWSREVEARVREYLAIEDRQDRAILSQFIREVNAARRKAERALRELRASGGWRGRANAVHLPPLPPLMLEDHPAQVIERHVSLEPECGEWLEPLAESESPFITGRQGKRHERDRLVYLLHTSDALGLHGSQRVKVAPDTALAAVYMLLAPGSYFRRTTAPSHVRTEVDAMSKVRKRVWPTADRRQSKRRSEQG